MPVFFQDTSQLIHQWQEIGSADTSGVAEIKAALILPFRPVNLISAVILTPEWIEYAARFSIVLSIIRFHFRTYIKTGLRIPVDFCELPGKMRLHFSKILGRQEVVMQKKDQRDPIVPCNFIRSDPR